jgi:hypothetical protein
VRIKALFSLAVLGYAGLALAQATPAQNVVVEERKTETVTVVVKETPKPPAFVFELHGFTSLTFWLQDAAFGLGSTPTNGQQALNALKRYDQDKILLGADVRQTRLNFSVRGPEVLGGATPKGVVEFDLFGGDSPGGFGDVSVFPRVRLAYAELKWASTTLQFGQLNMLTAANAPQSLRGHAFPMAYTAGLVGWRQPGIWGTHTMGGDTKFEFAWSIQRAGWANSTLTDGFNMGVASGIPALEARAKLVFGKAFDVWLAGHWQQADRNGPNVTENKAQNSTITTAMGVAGLKLDLGMLVVQGAGWYGKNAAPLLGSMLQFPNLYNPLAPTAYSGDIFGYGGWAQVGLNFSKEFSVWYMWGIDHPLYSNIFAARLPLMRNQNSVAMVRYQTGGFGMGVEWLYGRSTWNIAAGGSNTQAQLNLDNVVKANQFSASFNYYF